MRSTEELDWDHLRVFLAVMRSSSLRQAADRLHVSHPTIRRRVESLEEQVGLHLFDRRNDGLHATPEAVELLEIAEQVEATVHAFGRRAMDVDADLKGPITVTGPGPLLTELLMPDLLAFQERWPQIELRLETSIELRDLGSREADVAIRAVRHGTSPQDDLAGRKVVTAYTAIYGSDHQWIGWWGAERDREWIQETPYPDLPVRGAIPETYANRAACIAGMGLASMACFLATPEMVRRTKPKPAFDIWILVHPDLRRSPRLRVFRDEMAAALKGHQARLHGKA